jgi:hypothetical protein
VLLAPAEPHREPVALAARVVPPFPGRFAGGFVADGLPGR